MMWLWTELCGVSVGRIQTGVRVCSSTVRIFAHFLESRTAEAYLIWEPNL
jgi:hypothetical protein